MRPYRIAALTLALAACSSKPEAPPGFELTTGQGFSVQKPVGWQAEAVSPTRFVIDDPSSKSFAAITAMPVPPKPESIIHLEKWVKSGKVVSSDAPARNIRRAELALVDKDDQPLTARVVIVDGGGIATIFWASAPSDRFQTELPKLTTVLDSFRLAKPEPAARPAAPVEREYVIWVDPREQAFSTHVPKGWRVEGGLYRVGFAGTRAMVTATSPDNAIQFFMGDMSTPRFILPSELVCSLGNCNGQPMQNGDIVAAFMHAADIGAQIVQRRFGGQPTGRRDRQDIASFKRAKQPTMGGTINALTAADVDFRLQDGRVGTATIVNSGYNVPGLGGAWTVDEMWGFIAPAERTSEAAAVLGHALGLTRVNPQWMAGELKSQAAASKQYLAYLEESSSLQQRTLEERWASQDRQGREFRDALTNTVRLVDPQTHETIELQSSDRYFFRSTDPLRDGVIGTTTDDNPAPLDLRKLIEAR